MSFIPPIIDPKELIQLDPSKLICIDASAGSKARYAEKHLSGALYVDLDQDLAQVKPNAANGGRHPLPTLAQFSKLLGELGIDKASHVIVYDDKNNSNAAARFWWMLKAIGHDKVQVLNGGFDAAIKAGIPANAEQVAPKPTHPYPLTDWALPTVNIQEVEEASRTGNQTIIDVRSKERFDGLSEPIDLIAGHIPGAINIPFTENLDQNGFFLAPALLKEKYSKTLAGIRPEHTIVHCGSGVTACHSLLAMVHAGMEIPKLYIGSWSEWSRNNMDMVLAQR